MEEIQMIKENDTIYDIINKHSELKKVFEGLSPKFKNLSNPVLFNSVAKVTTVKKAAETGKIYLKEMLYQLNEGIGLGKEYLENEKKNISGMKESFLSGKKHDNLEKPSWFDKTGGFKTHDLRETNEPFNEIIGIASKTQSGQGFIILQKFEPLPVIGYLETIGFDHYTEKETPFIYKIYLFKK